MHGKRWSVVPLAVVLTTALAAVAIAASPHFTRNGSPVCTDTGSVLTCTGELVGLGNQDLVLALSSRAEATFLCGAPGNANTAPGQNKIPFQAGGSQTIDGDAIKNGRASFSVSAPENPPPTPTPQQAGCPNKNWQVVGSGDIDFTDPVLTITQGSLLFTCRYSGTVPEGGTVSLTCVPA
jgi:hypothetical protein